MKEDLLVDLERKEHFKKWRNVSIVLFCIILILFLGRNNQKNNNSKLILEDSIAEIKIDGIILNDDFRNEKIQEITNNNKIKGVIIDVDSPGGVVTPSEDLYELIYNMNKIKPVVILMDGMATSGAYMISLGADYLIAKNTTLTGSIGVLLQSYNFVGLANKFGVDLRTFKSSELKGMPSMFEKNTKNSNVALQSTIDDIYSYFVGLVKERRKIKSSNLILATNGQAFTGRQALKIGLIDEIGDINSAIKYLGTRGVRTDLPIEKISLKKKEKFDIINELTNRIFFDIRNSIDQNNINSNLLSIYKY